MNNFKYKVSKLVINFLSFGYRSSNVKKIKILKTGALGDFIFLLPSLYLLRSKSNCKIIIYFTIPNKTTVKHIKKYNSGKKIDYVEFFKPYLFDEVVYIENLFSIKLFWHNVNDLFIQKIIITKTPGENPVRLIKKIIFLRMNGLFNSINGTDFTYYRSKFNRIIHSKELKVFEHLNHYEANFLSIKSIFSDLQFSQIKPLNVNQYFSKPDILDYLDSIYVEKNEYVVMSIGSLKPHKIWPHYNYINLIKLICKNSNKKIVLSGTSLDLEISKAIEFEVDTKIINMVGKTSFRNLLILLSNANVVIGNDGGALHLAALFGKPVISISPSLEPKGSVAPIFNHDFQIINTSISCSPCYKMEECPLKSNECIKSISVDQVYFKFKEICNFYDSI